MWKDSTELLDYALREPEKAIENKTGNVKIILMNNFLGEKEDMIRIVEQLELKTITEMLREEYSGYNIRSKESYKKGIVLIGNSFFVVYSVIIFLVKSKLFQESFS